MQPQAQEDPPQEFHEYPQIQFPLGSMGTLEVPTNHRKMPFEGLSLFCENTEQIGEEQNEQQLGRGHVEEVEGQQQLATPGYHVPPGIDIFPPPIAEHDTLLASRELFEEALGTFHGSFGRRLTEVTACGGLEQLNPWREMASTSSSSATMPQSEASSSATIPQSEAALNAQPALEEHNEHQTVEEDTENKAHVPLIPRILEVEPWADIVQCLHGFLEKLQVERLWVISAIGRVSDVTISMAGSVSNFPGIFHILSLSGYYFPTGNSLTLIAYREKVIAGTVHGILRAAGRVNIITGTCADPSGLISRLPLSSGEDSDNTVSHYSEALAYATSLDSFTYDTLPITADYQPHHDAP